MELRAALFEVSFCRMQHRNMTACRSVRGDQLYWLVREVGWGWGLFSDAVHMRHRLLKQYVHTERKSIVPCNGTPLRNLIADARLYKTPLTVETLVKQRHKRLSRKCVVFNCPGYARAGSLDAEWKPVFRIAQFNSQLLRPHIAKPASTFWCHERHISIRNCHLVSVSWPSQVKRTSFPQNECVATDIMEPARCSRMVATSASCSEVSGLKCQLRGRLYRSFSQPLQKNSRTLP
jgi:hypothetical protein